MQSIIEVHRSRAAYKAYLAAKLYPRTGRRELGLKMTYVAEIPESSVAELRKQWEGVQMNRDAFHRRPYYRDGNNSLRRVFPRHLV